MILKKKIHIDRQQMFLLLKFCIHVMVCILLVPLALWGPVKHSQFLKCQMKSDSLPPHFSLF